MTLTTAARLTGSVGMRKHKHVCEGVSRMLRQGVIHVVTLPHDGNGITARVLHVVSDLPVTKDAPLLPQVLPAVASFASNASLYQAPCPICGRFPRIQAHNGETFHHRLDGCGVSLCAVAPVVHGEHSCKRVCPFVSRCRSEPSDTVVQRYLHPSGTARNVGDLSFDLVRG